MSIRHHNALSDRPLRRGFTLVELRRGHWHYRAAGIGSMRGDAGLFCFGVDRSGGVYTIRKSPRVTAVFAAVPAGSAAGHYRARWCRMFNHSEVPNVS